MDRNEYSNALAEVSFLEEMLRKPGLSMLSSKSMEFRLGKIRKDIATLKEKVSKPARAVITYRGAPVVGSFGVLAEFGANATRAFSDAVAAVAASLTGTLSDKGPIPNKPNNQLLITGTALGSFGFVLEESPTNAQLQLGGETAVQQALELIVDLLEASTGSDEELSEPVSQLANRAISSVVEFLTELANSEASCSLTTNHKKFRFVDANQVKTSKARLSIDNIKEESPSFSGVFIGVLPERRVFEFRTESGETMHGSIRKEIEQPSAINDYLGKKVTITLHSRMVGESKPRYAISELPWQIPH